MKYRPWSVSDFKTKVAFLMERTRRERKVIIVICVYIILLTALLLWDRLIGWK